VKETRVVEGEMEEERGGQLAHEPFAERDDRLRGSACELGEITESKGWTRRRW